MTKRAWFENFYGIPEIGGLDLVSNGLKQLKKWGTVHIENEVTDVMQSERGFKITTV